MMAARGEVSWRSPDETPRSVYMATERYLWPGSAWALLQALSSLARYHPAEWTTALDPDRSEWAVSIEKVLRLGLDVVPRLVLMTLSPGAVFD
jgi:hypothetical protein